jgi:hypothetical protein
VSARSKEVIRHFRHALSFLVVDMG